MLKLARKSVLAHKRRLIGTGLSVIIGIAFLAGTFVFTDTIKRTFDNLFADVYKNTDVYVRSNQSIESDFGQTQRPPHPRLGHRPGAGRPRRDRGRRAPCRASPASSARTASRSGSDQGPPTFGGELHARRAVAVDASPTAGRPSGANEVVLDRASFKDGNFALGDPVTIISQGGSKQFTVVGVVRFGDADSPGGATFALFDLPTAAVVHRPAGPGRRRARQGRRLGQPDGAGPARADRP